MPKRKTGEGMQKYYAVRAGVSPGIYRTWSECQVQITGFRGAIYKAFETEEDALAFVAGQTPPSENNKKAKPNQPPKFYAVASGHKPGIYTDWDTAHSEAIIGVKGPKFKKFATRAEAENFILQHGSYDTIKSLGLLPNEDDGGDDDEDEGEDGGTPVFMRANDGEAAAVAAGAKTSVKTADTRSIAVTTTAAAVKTAEAGLHGGVLNIYTDGSSLNNGKATARAGVGVFFGHGDERNVAEKLEGEPQTNQRAELAAILRALEVTSVDQRVTIFTDSSYSINCLTKWRLPWERNGWKNSKGFPVMNQDLIKGILARLDERKSHGTKTEFQWVKGHSQSLGNIAADALAVKGAQGW